nr:helix-turn-helix domain-containing protein [Streptomyces kasugaensis]
MLTTEEAAEVACVTPACIRKWVSRGHLAVTARSGSRNLYREDHVLAAERQRRMQRISRPPTDETFHADEQS